MCAGERFQNGQVEEQSLKPAGCDSPQGSRADSQKRQTHTPAINHVSGPALPVQEGWSAWCPAALESELKAAAGYTPKGPRQHQSGEKSVLQKWRLPPGPISPAKAKQG